MKKKVKVYVSLKQGVLDPQGKTIESSLHSLGFKEAANVRVGKVIEFEIAESADLENQIHDMCKKLLANPVMEDYRFEVEEVVRP